MAVTAGLASLLRQPVDMAPLLIGIAGGTGSGKSTVAHAVADALDGHSVAFVDMDAYYRSFAHLTLHERHAINWDHPDTFDLELLDDHLAALAAGEAIDKPIYDYTTHARRSETERVDPADVVVIDGVLLFADARLRERLHVKVFVDADADERVIRRIRRDLAHRGRQLEGILEQYETTVRPMHLEFVEPSKRYADLIIPRGGHNAVGIDLIVGLIHRQLDLQRA
ncbi:MAG: uridine kinase [Gemmatimonadaceae bacterium]|nr:uridine kinase [Gemmatimonadaceae bacterium]